MSDNRFGLFEPDTLLPVQFARIFYGTHKVAEKRLMLAVLEEAIECFQKYPVADDTNGQRLFNEAQEWIMSTDRSWIFSFESICDVFEIHPDWLRRGLNAWLVQTLRHPIHSLSPALTLDNKLLHSA